MTPRAVNVPRLGVGETRKLPELEGLRGLLALWVVITHILCWCGIADLTVHARFRGVWAMVIYAQPAVDVFIILSGFSIFHLLNEKPSSYGSFMTGRFFRIVPVYWLCLGAAVATGPLCHYLLNTTSWNDRLYLRWMADIFNAQREHWAAHVFWHIPLLHGLVPRLWLPYAGDAFLSPAWSVSLEWQFYLLAPLILALWRRRWPVVLLFAGGISSFWWATDFVNEHAAFLPLKLHLFLFGATCYFAERWLRTHAESGVKFGPLLVVSILIAAWLIRWQHWAITIWLLCFSASVGVWDSALPLGQKRLRALLLSPPVQWIGRRSYSFYLLHWPMIIAGLALIVWTKRAVSGLEALAYMSLIGLPCILGATALLHRVVEAPTLKLGRRLSHRLREASRL